MTVKREVLPEVVLDSLNVKPELGGAVADFSTNCKPGLLGEAGGSPAVLPGEAGGFVADLTIQTGSLGFADAAHVGVRAVAPGQEPPLKQQRTATPGDRSD